MRNLRLCDGEKIARASWEAKPPSYSLDKIGSEAEAEEVVPVDKLDVSEADSLQADCTRLGAEVGREVAGNQYFEEDSVLQAPRAMEVEAGQQQNY